MKRKVALTLLFLLSFIQLFAQGVPGGCDDADDCENVPLDNWLIILVVGGLILTTIYLHNKQKREATA